VKVDGALWHRLIVAATGSRQPAYGRLPVST
jgi:hypothetical protein